MSSSGNAVGITTAYIRDAQDFTLQRKRMLVFQDGIADTHTPNGNERYLTSLLGAKECSELTCFIPDTLTVLRYSTYQGDSFLWDGDIFTRNVNYPGNLYTGISSIATTVPNPSALIGVTLNSVTSIGDSAFADCTSLTSIEIPDSVTSIGEVAFAGCTSLTSIEIPDSVISIGIYAFEDCTSLTSIEIPTSVTSISVGVFYYCTSLTSVILNSVTSIDYEAFYNCYALTTITIPDSVTDIGNNAFQNSGLATVYIAHGQLEDILSPSRTRNVSFFGATVETVLP